MQKKFEGLSADRSILPKVSFAKQAETFAEIIEEPLSPKQDLKEMEFAFKRDMQEMKTDIIKWVAAMLVAQAAIVATLVKLL